MSGGRASPPSGAPDRKNDPEAVHERDQIASQPAVSEQRPPEQSWPSRYRHHDRRADHERRRHDADGRAIDRTVEAITEGVEALEIEVDP